MIRDLEELLLTVLNDDSRAYVHEAVKCYNAGAYRAAVVLSVAAGMDGLRQNLEKVATSGSASDPIKKAYKTISDKFVAQNAYEDELINVCRTHASIITSSEADKLLLLLKTRHLCAHPSGHKGTPEEARDAIASVIELILSRPALMGINGVLLLIDRLAGPMFFPNITDDNKVRATVETELLYISPDSFDALASNIVLKILDVAAKVTNRTATTNATRSMNNFTMFLAHLTKLNSKTRQIVWKCLGRLIENPATTWDALFVLAYDPEGIGLADRLLRDRAIALIRRNISNKYAGRAACSMREKSLLNTDEMDEITQSAIKAFVTKDVPSGLIVEQVVEFAWPELDAPFFDRVIHLCGRMNFDIANSAIELMQKLTEQQASRMSQAQQISYILTIAENASRSNSANKADTITEKGLGVRSVFIEALKTTLQQDKSALPDISTDWEHVARICVASSRLDLLPLLISVFDPPNNKSYEGLKMLRFLAGNKDAVIAGAANLLYKHIRDTMVGEAPLYDDDV